MFIVRQIPDNQFQRDGDDLIEHVRIKLTDALSETKIDVPHLDGRILRVPLKEVSLPLGTLILLADFLFLTCHWTSFQSNIAEEG